MTVVVIERRDVANTPISEIRRDPEWYVVRETLSTRLSLHELQLRQIAAEIECKPFDSLAFVELVMGLEQAIGIRIPL